MPRVWNDYDYFRIATPTGLKYINQLTYKDVAHSLANQNRFSGHLDRQVSIGAHSLHCLFIARIVGLSAKLQKAALWHDGPESYYSDIPTYVKAHFDTRTVEYIRSLDDDFHKKFRYPQLTLTEKGVLKELDRTALTIEAMYGLDNFNLNDWPPPTMYQQIDLIKNVIVFYNVEENLIHYFRSFQNV